MEAIKVAPVAHSLYHGTVAVGYKRRCRLFYGLCRHSLWLNRYSSCRTINAAISSHILCRRRRWVLCQTGTVVYSVQLGPVVVVLHHHKPVARRKLFLPPKHLVAYALVVYVGALVRPRHHHRLVHAHLRVARCKRLDKLVARHIDDVGKSLEPNLGQLRSLVMGYHLAYNGGVVENARLLTLSQHLLKVALVHRQSVAPHEVGAQGRRFFLAHRWQLRLVADKHQPAVAARIYKLHKVVQQASRAKHRPLQALIGYHRRLVHHKEGVGVHVGRKRESSLHRLLPVDAAVYGGSRRVRVDGEHLGGTARRSQQHHPLLEPPHRAHNGTRQRRLARTSRTAHYHHSPIVAVCHERGKRGKRPALVESRLKAEALPYLVYQFVV